ncbi:MAG TPA: hypothetical protein VJV74_08795, partial [Terriglobia bacterium]|nr:hypothetical protein [Terriglobia bacterium]
MPDIELLIEQTASDDIDRLALHVAPALYGQLGDDAALWLVRRVRLAQEADGRRRYLNILTGMGYWSDGFTEELMDDVMQDVVAAATSAGTRASLAVACLQHTVYFRPSGV